MSARPPVEAEPFLRLEVMVGPPQDAGDVDGAGRRCIPLLGGVVSGAYEGVVLPGGADWQTVTRSGLLEIRAHYMLDLGGRLVEVSSEGVRQASPEVTARLMRGEPVSPDDYYFRTAIRLKSAAPDLARLNGVLFVAVGERLADRVRLAVHRVL